MNDVEKILKHNIVGIFEAALKANTLHEDPDIDREVKDYLFDVYERHIMATSLMAKEPLLPLVQGLIFELGQTRCKLLELRKAGAEWGPEE